MYDLFNNALKTSGYIACDGRMVSELRIGNNMKGSGCVLNCYDGLCIEEYDGNLKLSACWADFSCSPPEYEVDRYVWLFQFRPCVLKECGIIIQDCLGSESFDCAVAAQLYSQDFSRCCLGFHERPNVECSGLTTTVAYHLAGRGRGSACSNVKSCAAL